MDILFLLFLIVLIGGGGAYVATRGAMGCEMERHFQMRFVQGDSKC